MVGITANAENRAGESHKAQTRANRSAPGRTYFRNDTSHLTGLCRILHEMKERQNPPLHISILSLCRHRNRPFSVLLVHSVSQLLEAPEPGKEPLIVVIPHRYTGSVKVLIDNPAGIAEIITAAERLVADPSIPHGVIRLCFTPDEEISAGTKYFDVEKFGADIAYTIDGGPLGELEYENFNGATASITIHGKSFHPGASKGRMINALILACELQGMLPFQEQPAYTEGYEGFYHLTSMGGTVASCTTKYLIRQHDRGGFEWKKGRLAAIVRYLNEKYGEGTVDCVIEDKYYNMKEIIEQHMYLIDRAEQAYRSCGIQAKRVPVRGGTDGARLSFKGLPCPNLSTSGHNFHGVYEYIPVESMERMADVLVNLVRLYAGPQ